MIIATPGRLIEIISKHEIHLETVSMVVLDEVDLMLQMGFEKQVSDVLVHIRSNHQTLVFSATIPRKTEELVFKIMKKYVSISVGDVRCSLLFLMMFIAKGTYNCSKAARNVGRHEPKEAKTI